MWIPLRQRAGGGRWYPEAQITTENGQTALRQDKEAARLPSHPQHHLWRLPWDTQRSNVS